MPHPRFKPRYSPDQNKAILAAYEQLGNSPTKAHRYLEANGWPPLNVPAFEIPAGTVTAKAKAERKRQEKLTLSTIEIDQDLGLAAAIDTLGRRIITICGRETAKLVGARNDVDLQRLDKLASIVVKLKPLGERSKVPAPPDPAKPPDPDKPEPSSFAGQLAGNPPPGTTDG